MSTTSTEGFGDPLKVESAGDFLSRVRDDASLWAAEFNATAQKLGYSKMDESWLTGWFANAIENTEMVRRERWIVPSNFDDVGEFHKKFGLPHAGDGRKPQLLDEDVQTFRVRFMQEELDEFDDAYRNGDTAKAADALCDLAYVALGTAHLMAVPFDQCWDEVQRANMSKVRASGADDPLSKRKHSLDVVKPEGWRPPDLQRVIDEAS